MVRRKFDLIVQSDLAEIVSGVDSTVLLDHPRYEVVQWQHYDESRYSYLAKVDYYFLSSLSYKIHQEYRYNLTYKKWERFINEYKAIEPN